MKSSDWWRRVGAILLLKNGVTIPAHNTHLPDPHTPYILGDMRAQFHRGEHFELTSSIHAEALAIATAAKRGLSVQGAKLFVTDFPCPVCAKLIGASGITHVYYYQGYALADGADILKAYGVSVYQVEPPL
jgi:dCMP deaminase